MARDERRFKMADQDKDMRANKEEFTAFLHPEEYDHMKDIVVLVSGILTAVIIYDINSLSFVSCQHCELSSFSRKPWKILTRMEMV